MKLSFVVFGTPRAQPRQRHRVITTKFNQSFVHNYTSKRDPVNDWKRDIQLEASRICKSPFVGPLRVDIALFFLRPQRLMTKKAPDGPMWHTVKPDRDNLEKAILDALKGILFLDDCQVCAGEVKKFYTEKDRDARAEISVSPLVP